MTTPSPPGDSDHAAGPPATPDERDPVGATFASLDPEQYDIVDTGDLLPAGRDAVVMRERLRVGAEGRWQLHASVTAGKHVRPVGEDIAAGEAHTAVALEGLGRIAVHGVAMRPRHPIVLAALSRPTPVPSSGLPAIRWPPPVASTASHHR